MSADPVFPFYRVVFVYDRGEGTAEEATTLMKPWLFKEDPGATVVEARARETWPNITWHFEPEIERRLLRVEVERKNDVPWALGWFSHETYRCGRTDAELRESFERYVQCQERIQGQAGVPCLMGADDRWRWQPFCTCVTCQRDDLAMITH